jgi:hypothetical protein
MKPKSHILDWRTVNPGGRSKTLCGVTIVSATGELIARVANNPHDADCQRCRKKRDGRE